MDPHMIIGLYWFMGDFYKYLDVVYRQEFNLVRGSIASTLSTKKHLLSLLQKIHNFSRSFLFIFPKVHWSGCKFRYLGYS